MTQSQQPHYVALISLTLPGSDKRVTANVALTPKDAIPDGDQYKRLTDCTLADLHDFAQQLEAEVWQTFQQIKLVDLAQDQTVQMDLIIQDGDGEPVTPSKKWLQEVVVLPAALTTPTINETETAVTITEEPEPEATTAPTTETAAATTVEASTPEETAAPSDESLPDEAAPAMEAPAANADVESEETETETAVPSAQSTIVEEITLPQEDVAEVAADIHIIVSEAEPVHEERDAVEDYDGAETVIAPSQARVRVAGKRLPSGHPTSAAVDILIDEPALRAAQAHALSSLNREVAGVLIGPRPEKQPDGRYLVHVIDTVVAKHTVMQGASVTYTPESWRYMTDKLTERYPDETAVIVGWYHTHPGFGIFLSGMDLFIHQNFFTQIWHIAYVLDPRARSSGFFCWDRRQTQVSRHNFAWPEWAAGSW